MIAVAGARLEPAQDMLSNRAPRTGHGGSEGIGGVQPTVELLRQILHSDDLVHHRSDHRELQALGPADIAVDHLAPVEGEAKLRDRSVAGSAAPSSRRASWAASIVSPIERRPRTRGPQVISMRYAARSGGEAPHFGARPEGRARRSIPYLRYANIGVDGRQSPHTLHSSYPLQFIPFELFTPRTEGPVSHHTDSAFGSPSRHWVRRKGYGEGICGRPVGRPLQRY
jgi:hypothetical protein